MDFQLEALGIFDVQR